MSTTSNQWGTLITAVLPDISPVKIKGIVKQAYAHRSNTQLLSRLAEDGQPFQMFRQYKSDKGEPVAVGHCKYNTSNTGRVWTDATGKLQALKRSKKISVPHTGPKREVEKQLQGATEKMH